MEQIKPFSAITEEHIQDWKARHGDVLSEVTVGESRFIVRIPGRRTLDLMAQHGKQNDVVAANGTLINNTVLGGDIDAMDSDGGVYAGLLEQLMKLLEKKKASLKKV